MRCACAVYPDKLCDQISDALLDSFLAQDPESKVACETLATTGLVVCAGEVKTNAYVSIDDVVRDVIKEIGYDKSDYQNIHRTSYLYPFHPAWSYADFHCYYPDFWRCCRQYVTNRQHLPESLF